MPRPTRKVAVSLTGELTVEPLAKAVLDANARDHIAAHNFALPGGRYPIHDETHARAALAYVSQHGTADEQTRVHAAVAKKYPGMEVSPLAKAGGGTVNVPSIGTLQTTAVPPESDARPPSKRVKFRHPDTGEERDGTVQAGGKQGITVTDDQTGQAHQVAHGHYVVHPDEDGPGGKAPPAPACGGGAAPGGAAPGGGAPAAPAGGGGADKVPTEQEGLAQGDEKADRDRKFGRLKKTANDLPAHRDAAHKAMRQGVDSHAAHKAAAALLAAHTGRPTHHLKAGDVEVDGKKVKVKRGAQQDVVEDKHLASFVGAAKKSKKDDEPLFAGKDHRGQPRPVTSDDVDDHLSEHMHGATLDDVRRYHETKKATEGKAHAVEHVDPKVGDAMKRKVKPPEDDEVPDDEGDGHTDDERKFLGMLDRVGESKEPTDQQPQQGGGDGR